MQVSDILSGAVAIGGVLIAALAYFKYTPGQREGVDMNVAQANLSVAQGTIQLVTTELEDQFKRMSTEMTAMRREENTYRADTQSRLDELGVLLRAAIAEKEHVKRENEHLKARVDELEAEVRSLKDRDRPRETP